MILGGFYNPLHWRVKIFHRSEVGINWEISLPSAVGDGGTSAYAICQQSSSLDGCPITSCYLTPTQCGTQRGLWALGCRGDLSSPHLLTSQEETTAVFGRDKLMGPGWWLASGSAAPWECGLWCHNSTLGLRSHFLPSWLTPLAVAVALLNCSSC